MATLPQPTLVVVAWNRLRTLQRLLGSLLQAHYPVPTRLHVSVDAFLYDDAIRGYLQGFAWPHGELVVEHHPERLGLRQHMLYCGGLTARYGAIVLLEDDLVVAPYAYDYAQQALAFVQDDPRIAGISLYQYKVAESCHQPFEPWQDRWDNWYLQLPSSWGAAFTAAQWSGFETWLAANASHLPVLPDYIAQWSSQSWKRLFAAYLIHQGKYFSYPRFALATNFEDFGAHANTRGLFQVPLLMGQRTWQFGGLDASEAVYDAHFEPLAGQLQHWCPALAGYDFAVDLLGQKSKAFLDRPWVLTRRRGGESVLSFAAEAIPLELNVYLQSAGEQLRLVPASTDWLAPDDLELEFRYYAGVSKTAVLHLPARRMPSISLVVPCSFVWDEDDGFSAQLIAEAYPGKELIMVVEPDMIPSGVLQGHDAGLLRMVECHGSLMDCIQAGVAAASGELIWVTDQHVTLQPGIFHKIAKIFHQYPGLDWLSAMPDLYGHALRSQQIAQFRWDTARFQSADAAQVRGYLPLVTQVYRRALWMQAIGEAQTWQAHLQGMAQLSLPQVADLTLAVSVESRRDGLASHWGTGWVNRSRRYYHRHIPLLWKWHRHLSDYKPVLRYDEGHDTWFEFDY